MPDAPQELRRINWSACFPFTQIFQTFRLATHPEKLALALLGILLTGFSGWMLDLIWMQKHQPVAGEVNAFWQTSDIDAWRENTSIEHAAVIREIYAHIGKEEEVPDDLLDDFQKKPRDTWNDALAALKRSYADQVKEIQENEDQSKKWKAERIAETARVYNALHAELMAVRPVGVFHGFLGFYTKTIRQVIEAGRSLNFTGGLNEVLTARQQGRGDFGLTDLRGYGVLPSIFLLLRAEQWLITQHFWYALLFGLLALIIWSLLGGAICRMAAISVARQERIPMKSAMGFAARKFAGFAIAPLLPIIMVALIGIVMIIGGLVCSIPIIGEILAGLTMGLALVGGFVAALIIVGALAGYSLWWPTIAVEGSDGFDAIARSYSYIFSRPWHAGFYAAVALVYGSICYLFARFFVWLLLRVTHFFVGIGMGIPDRPGTGTPDAGKLDAMWQAPGFNNLAPTAPPFAARGIESFGSGLISIWVFLLVMLLCAFLVTFYLSGSTVIYYLLRRRVDAIDFEDVYLDEDLEGEEYAYTTESGAGEGGPSAPPAEDTEGAPGASEPETRQEAGTEPSETDTGPEDQPSDEDGKNDSREQ